MFNFPFLPVEGLHEFNLDWFLKRFHELSEEWDETKAAWIALKEWVENYFDNLDVQTEINNKIDEMYENGTLETILSHLIKADIPVFVDSTDEMTDNKLIYVLSNTGHIWAYKDGAFYDTGVNYTAGLESVTGSLVHITINNVEQYNDFNTLTTNNIYAIDPSSIRQMENAPDNIIFNLNALLIDLSYNKKNTNSGGRLQILKSITNGYLYIRGKWADTWYPWVLLTPYNKIFTGNDTLPYNSADDFPDNSSIFLHYTITSEQLQNLPEYGLQGCMITNTSYDNNAKVQIFVTTRKIYSRIKWSTWSEWILNTTSGTLINADNLSRFNDVNNFMGNTVENIFATYTSEDISNLPVDGVQQVIHTVSNFPNMSASGAIGIQISVADNGSLYIRQKFANSYSAWQRVGFTGRSHPVILTTTTTIKEDYQDADTFPANEVVCCSVNPSQIANLPVYNTPLSILTFNYTSIGLGGRVQIAFAIESGMIFYRSAWGGAYRGWCMLNGNYFSNTVVDKTKKLESNSYILAFGDSMMATTGGSLTIPNLIAQMVGCGITNLSVPSARFDSSYTTNNIIKQINNASSELNPTHIFINGGTNDATNHTDMEIYKNSVSECINALKTKYPNANITYLTPFPRNSLTTGSLQYYGGLAAHIFIQAGCDNINCFDAPVTPRQNMLNFEYDYTDGTHLNDNAKRTAAKFISQNYL